MIPAKQADVLNVRYAFNLLHSFTVCSFWTVFKSLPKWLLSRQRYHLPSGWEKSDEDNPFKKSLERCAFCHEKKILGRASRKIRTQRVLKSFSTMNYLFRRLRILKSCSGQDVPPRDASANSHSRFTTPNAFWLLLKSGLQMRHLGIRSDRFQRGLAGWQVYNCVIAKTVYF